MKKISNDKKRGFTIIEVSLVLAIAGLIFLMIFVALPALQRNSRDAQRRDDLMTYLEQLKKYQTNNRGNLPKDWGDFMGKYFRDRTDPSTGDDYKQKIVECGSGPDKPCTDSTIKEVYGSDFPYDGGSIVVIKQATCGEDENGDVFPVGTSNPRSVAALYRLEVGGVYCDNI